jgi:Cdc6-like AAA superfamily ATPase
VISQGVHITQVKVYLYLSMPVALVSTVCGSPTHIAGKSLTAHEILRRCIRHTADPKSHCTLPPALIAINCMSLKGPADVATRIVQGYHLACLKPHPANLAAGDDPVVYPAEMAAGNLEACKGSTASVSEQLRQIVMQPLPVIGGVGVSASASRRPKHKQRTGGRAGCERGMLVVLLDELDNMLTGKVGEALIEELFVLAHHKTSRLVLIGIANSIDLVQQLLKPGGPLHVSETLHQCLVLRCHCGDLLLKIESCT